MKYLSRVSNLAAFAVIGCLAVLAFRVFAQSPPLPQEPDTKFVLKIKKTHEVKDETAFGNALQAIKRNGAIYTVHMVHSNNKADDLTQLDLTTDKVTTSELAQSAATGEYTAIGSNVTQRIASENLADMQTILSQLK